MIFNKDLFDFDKTNEMHLEALQKLAFYDFRKQLNELLLKLTPKLFFVEESKKYLVDNNGNFYVSMVAIDKDYNDLEYLIGSHKIYFRYSDISYFESTDLTSKWRKIMKQTYPNSDYVDVIKAEIEQEINELVEMIKEFVETEWSNEERHLRRVNKIINYEQGE